MTILGPNGRPILRQYKLGAVTLPLPGDARSLAEDGVKVIHGQLYLHPIAAIVMTWANASVAVEALRKQNEKLALRVALLESVVRRQSDGLDQAIRRFEQEDQEGEAEALVVEVGESETVTRPVTGQQIVVGSIKVVPIDEAEPE